MFDLMVSNHNGTLVIDSRDVAKVINMRHSDLLSKINAYNEILLNGKFRSMDYFVPNDYKDSIGRTLPCYLLTKQGCEMVANKLTGEKGVLFTAAYVQKFNEMEKKQLSFPGYDDLSPEVRALIKIELQQKEQAKALEATNRRIDAIGEIFSVRPDNWRSQCTHIIAKIAEKKGGYSHIADTNREIYALMKSRFSIDLKRRLENMRLRAAGNCVSKTNRDKLNYLDVIETDKKLIEAYMLIVKETAIRYGIDEWEEENDA